MNKPATPKTWDKLSKGTRRRLIAKLAKPDENPYEKNPPPAWEGIDPRAFHQSFGKEGATLADLLRRIVNALDRGYAPDRPVCLTVANVNARIGSMCDSFWSFNLGATEDKAIESVWSLLNFMQAVVKAPKKYRKDDIIATMRDLLERAGRLPAEKAA